MFGGDVALFLGVNEVQGGHGFHRQLGCALLGEVLGVVGAVEVVPAQGGLTTRHVAADDEMRAAVVAADDHVLQGFTGTRHVHGVGQVGPANPVVVHLSGQALVGLEADGTRNVVLLSGATGGVHQHHGVLADVLGVQSAGEQLVVGTVDRVAALESHHVLSIGETGAHLCRRLAGEHALGQFKALEAASQVEALALHGDHPHCRVLNGGGAVAALGFSHLVGFPLGLHLQNGEVLPLVGQQHRVTDHHVIAVGVHHDRQTEQLAGRQAMAAHDSVVILLMHEAPQGGETAHHQQFHIAGIAV